MIDLENIMKIAIYCTENYLKDSLTFILEATDFNEEFFIRLTPILEAEFNTLPEDYKHIFRAERKRLFLKKIIKKNGEKIRIIQELDELNIEYNKLLLDSELGEIQ